MVRRIWVEVKGELMQVEDSPDVCPNGHSPVLPGWGPYPCCGYAGRRWRCTVDGCTAVALDDEHRCR